MGAASLSISAVSGVAFGRGGGDDLDGHTSLSGVGGSQSLPSGVGLGLEVQVVHALPVAVASPSVCRRPSFPPQATRDTP